ncbi:MULTISPECIES: hypothetical protein [Streptomyces]|uniref:hypothetical protein n=1 Tax=Streptomyces TaxID=1883 RepID=UPI0004CA5005|nr:MULTISPECIES: hypothetical protein [Streptomyces]WUA89855.1 hypothetical protein OHO81_22235 [Streptomyces pseudovenezuelae]
MNRSFRKIGGTALAGSVLLTGFGLVSATPAAAADTCSAYQSKEFDTPGVDVDVKIRLCVRKSGGVHLAYAEGTWGDGGGPVANFEQFDIHVRVERSDVVKNQSTCSLSGDLNLYGSGSFDERGTSRSGSLHCGFMTSTTASGTGGWSADGSVTYNINNDGEGAHTWDLTGSPTIG